MVRVAVWMAILVWAEACAEADTGRPYQLSVGGPAPVRITRSGYQQYDFTLLRPGCTIAGNIASLAGGDFDAAVLDNSGFRRWRRDHQTQALWRADRVATATVGARFGKPGLYHLVVSSTFARLTSTPVTVLVHAQVECH
jgi:hypothetical protein